MPQLIVLTIAGAGLLAGYKWLSKRVATYTETERARAEAARDAAAAAVAPKEMGHLEWDADVQAYRPTRH